MKLMLIVLLLLTVLSLYKNKGYWGYLLAGVFAIMFWRWQGVDWLRAYQCFLILYVAVAIIFGVRKLRMKLVTRYIKPLFAKALPRISETERAALEAGGTWWDADLFSG